MTRRREPLEERFWKYVDKSGDCWLWTGGSSGTPTGRYGLIKEDAPSRRQLGAHRVAYELANGPIPEGMVIDHRCHVTLCVNPAHLRAVTSKQNSEHKEGASRVSKSGYLGVYEYIPGWWRGAVKHHGEKHYTGRCATPEEADVAVKALRNALFTHNDHDRVTKLTSNLEMGEQVSISGDAVEAAAKALRKTFTGYALERPWDSTDQQAVYRADASAALEAAVPYLRLHKDAA